MRIGIDVGGSHIGIGLVDDLGKIIVKKEQNIIKGSIGSLDTIQRYNSEVKGGQEKKENIVYYLKKFIEEIIEENKVNGKIHVIGIAFPAKLHKGKIGRAINLGVIGEEIREALEEYFNIPTYIRNDAKCAAICEKIYGSLKEYNNAVFLTIGTGIGGAVFIGNKLLTSGGNDTFEIGHSIIQKQGIQCNCGKQGCFEKYASISALKTNVKQSYNIETEITGQELRNFITQNEHDEKMQKMLDEYIENLTIGISNIINLFEPEAISIGGSFAYYEDIFLQKLRQKIQDNATIHNQSSPTVMLAKFRNDAGIIGATRIVE